MKMYICVRDRDESFPCVTKNRYRKYVTRGHVMAHSLAFIDLPFHVHNDGPQI